MEGVNTLRKQPKFEEITKNAILEGMGERKIKNFEKIRKNAE